MRKTTNKCPKCQGFIVNELLYPYDELYAWKCVNCGRLDSPVFVINQLHARVGLQFSSKGVFTCDSNIN